MSTFNNPHYDMLLLQLLRQTSILPSVPWLLNSIARAATWPKPQNRPEAKLDAAVRIYGWHASQLLIAIRSQLSTIAYGELTSDTITLVTKYFQDEITQLEWEFEHNEDEWEFEHDENEREEAAWYKQAIHEPQELLAILTNIDTVD